MLSRRKCCCPRGGDCYPSCVSCGHRYNWAAGSVTDDNGTWGPSTGAFGPTWFPTSLAGPAWEYGTYLGRMTQDPVLVAYNGAGSSTCGEATVEYGAEFRCDLEEGKVSCRLFAYFFEAAIPALGGCPDLDVVFDKCASVEDPERFTGYTEWVHATPTSCDPLTATFSSFTRDDWPASLPLTTTEVEISIPIDESVTTGSNYVCAVPCKVPRADLTLSWDNTEDGPGDVTLTWNAGTVTWSTSSGPWGTGDTGTAELSIDVNGRMKLAIGSCPVGLGELCIADYDCDPAFHVHYEMDAAACLPCAGQACQSLIDLGYTDFYVDE